MMKVRYYKCPECPSKVKFKTLNGWGEHMKKHHPESIPDGYSIARYFYYIFTGKNHGTCRTCKGPTEWNENSMKYNQYCKNPKCKEAYMKIAKQRMIDKYGKVHLLNDPDMQRKMMTSRKISGVYTFHDGTQIAYVASYEKNFLKMLNEFLHWPGNDIIGPSPHNYEYEYKNPNDPENEGKKIYIPDYYIPSLNLEIEIKPTQMTHPKFVAIDKVKEKLKDEVMYNNPNVNYIKIVDNDYSNFFEYLLKLKEMNTIDDKDDSPIQQALESYYISLADIDNEISNEAALGKNLPNIIDPVKLKFSQLDMIYNKMKKLRIGFIRNDVMYFGEKNIEKHISEYRTSPNNVISDKKIGLHFDFTQYLNKLLRKYNFEYQNFYIQFDNNMLHSHTFTAIKVAEGYAYIETFRRSIEGVYYPNSVDDIVNFVISDMVKQYNSDKFKVYKYNIHDKIYPGRTLQEIVKYITINGTRVYHIYSDLFNIIKVEPRDNNSK